MDSPTPIPFASVTGRYLVAVEGDPAWCDAAMKILGLGLAELGVGAKTNAGYGRMALDYEAKKEQARKRSADESREGRDVAPLPKVKNAKRKKRCERDLRLFAEQYFPELFPLAWSEDHLKVISKIETAVLHGGLFAMAMPRGSGKTTLAEVAAVWAVVYGHRGFVVLIGATALHAKEMLDSVKSHFLSNDRLAEDFPEVCHPIREMEGMANRCKGQLCDGEHTHIRWGAAEIVLPVVTGSTEV